MIRFRNFRTPPYSPHETQIVLHGICNLLHKEFKLEPARFNPFVVSQATCSVFADYGIPKQATGDFGRCQFLVQDLIDFLIEKKILTIQEIEREVQMVSNQYPPVFYPPMP